MSGHTRILVTGGAGFIGSSTVRAALELPGVERVVTLDKLTYAGRRDNLTEPDLDPRHVFVEGDIADGALVRRLLAEHEIDAVLHLAAESHVDRSIDGPGAFVRTNVVGTFELLEASRHHLAAHAPRAPFRFLHVSTNEVYGSLASGTFTETSPYAPRSPYSASKAGGDHLVRAYHATYGLPTLLTHATNNFGPRQFPEKLIPVTVLNALEGRPIPVYGDGRNVRDWMYVDDHVEGLLAVLQRGQPGETYNVGARTERSNLELVHLVCAELDLLFPARAPHAALIEHVADRPGHDQRYAIDPSRAENELGWRPRRSFEEGLRTTVRWYVDHLDWCARASHDRRRLGLAGAP